MLEEVADQARLDKIFLKCSTLTESLQVNLENWTNIPSYPRDAFTRFKDMVLPITLCLLRYDNFKKLQQIKRHFCSVWDIVSDYMLRYIIKIGFYFVRYGGIMIP